MCTAKTKTVLTRRALQWDYFLQRLLERVKENGYEKNIFKPELERLILKHHLILEIEKDIIQGFEGVREVNKEVKSWMKGEERIIEAK